MRHYVDWLTGVKDGRYNRTPLTMRQWRQVTRIYDERRTLLSRRAYLRGYKRGQRARFAHQHELLHTYARTQWQRRDAWNTAADFALRAALEQQNNTPKENSPNV